MSNKITRADAQKKRYEIFDVNFPQGIRGQILVDTIFDYVEALEKENKRLYQKNNTAIKHGKNMKARAIRVNKKNNELEIELANAKRGF